MRRSYTEESIQNMMLLLNHLEITGIENAKRIVMLESILLSGEEIEESKQIQHFIRNNEMTER